MIETEQNKPSRKLILVILDGFGEASESEINNPELNQFNAIHQAKTPFFDTLNSEKKAKKTLLQASAIAVGLPENQMGNSEVGHLNIGAGRVVYQDIVRINLAIQNAEFHSNPTLKQALSQLVQSKGSLHIIGLCSDGGVHSHLNHLIALHQLACQNSSIKQIYFHLILDGRDVPPRSAKAFIESIENQINEQDHGKIASIIGRYYAMDRDRRWDRIQEAYDLIASGKAEREYDTAISALEDAYANNVDDEFVRASKIDQYQGMKKGDLAVFMNFRADRARQLTHAFVDPNFNEFELQKLGLQDFITLTQYQKDLKNQVIFEPLSLQNTLGEVLAKENKFQLRIAETEKYAHVTYFFSGGKEACFQNEERVLINSPKVKTYDLKPEMSALELTEKLKENLKSGRFDFIVCNYANPDMVGHTGKIEAAIKAVETIDACMAEIAEVCEKKGYDLLITADHGNVEKMYDKTTNQPHTAHTLNPVPLYYLGNQDFQFKKEGKLSNIAPTILDLMGLKQPPEMSETSLMDRKKS